MMTARENYLALKHGEKPERFVNQYEAFAFLPTPMRMMDQKIRGQDTKDSWGTVIRWKAEDFASMPYITEENKVCPDVTRWQESVKAPDYRFSDEAWAPVLAEAAKVDRKERFLATIVSTGLFERCHYLMGFEDTLMNLLLEPEAMHELIAYIAQWRIGFYKELIDRFHPDAVLAHDDWGAKDRLFMSAEIWREFYKPHYAEIYAYVKSRGVHIVHHADSYLEPIVADMAEIGIDTWQGTLPSNDIPAIQKRLGGKMLLMGGLDAGLIDRADWTEAAVRAEVERACRAYGPGGGFIPCITYGGAESIYPGVYEMISDEIDRQSAEAFAPGSVF